MSTTTDATAQVPPLTVGPSGYDLLIPPGLYHAVVSEIRHDDDDAGGFLPAYKSQIWTFTVMLPGGEQVQYAGDEHIVDWADALLGRPNVQGSGKMPDADERAALVGQACSIRFSLHCRAEAPAQQRRTYGFAIPGGKVMFSVGRLQEADWCNKIESVVRPEDVPDEDDYAWRPGTLEEDEYAG